MISEEEKGKYIENINCHLDNLINICYEKSNMQEMTATGIKIIKQPILLIFDDLLNKIEQLKNLNEHQSKDITKAVDYTFELNKEIEIKDKMIDEMAELFLTMAKDRPGTTYHYLEKDGFSLQQCSPCNKQQENWTCAECFKEHFRKKVEK